MKLAILLISLLVITSAAYADDSGTQGDGTPVGVNSAPNGTSYR